MEKALMISAVAIGALALIGVIYLIVRPMMMESCLNDYCSVSKTYNGLMKLFEKVEKAAPSTPDVPPKKTDPKKTLLKQKEVRWKKIANYEA